MLRADRSAIALLLGLTLLGAVTDPNSEQRHAVAGHFNVPRVPAASATARNARNLITNPGFESGQIDGGWYQCGDSPAFVTRTHPHNGAYDEYSGTRSGTGEPLGNSGVCQAIAIPAGASLTAHVYQLSNELDTRYAYQEADLLDDRGNVVVNLYKSVNYRPAWVRGTWNLGAYAGRTYWLYFGVHGDGYQKLATQQFVDDVTLTGGTSPSRE
jgi:hypothetical protein